MHWRDEYLLGIQEIDNQHKTLIGLFDAIEEAVKQGKNWTTTYFHIAELRDYARFHFACEEALMRVFNFADICVCVGVALWVLVILLEEVEDKPSKEQ